MPAGAFDEGREPVVTMDVGNGPKVAMPIWHTDKDGKVVAAWELSDGTIVLDSEMFPNPRAAGAMYR